ncbi:MAG TPA: endolytic transglycosylase MltG [Gemmatimonadetes bacterium]|nr:endolytic transglycosylase MltG [Gemmatimonadota bacterium]
MKNILFATLLLLGCTENTPGDLVTVRVHSGMPFDALLDTLVTREILEHPRLVRLYARVTGKDRKIQAGEYALRQKSDWKETLQILTKGTVITFDLTIPEGLTLKEIAEKISEHIETPTDQIYADISDTTLDKTWSLPGPGLEGYLFPDTYQFPTTVSLKIVLETIIEQYKSIWTPERLSRLHELGMSERELMTLASIIQSEARIVEEMPIISSVYHNRLQLGYLLQADPTVIYALGSRRPRLLFAAIDSVADSPYNTYTHPGLPPGPIAAAGEQAIDAALYPSEDSYLYFVAQSGGHHIFSKTLQEHNLAIVESRSNSSNGP